MRCGWVEGAGYVDGWGCERSKPCVKDAESMVCEPNDDVAHARDTLSKFRANRLQNQ